MTKNHLKFQTLRENILQQTQILSPNLGHMGTRWDNTGNQGLFPGKCCPNVHQATISSCMKWSSLAPLFSLCYRLHSCNVPLGQGAIPVRCPMPPSTAVRRVDGGSFFCLTTLHPMVKCPAGRVCLWWTTLPILLPSLALGAGLVSGGFFVASSPLIPVI